MSQCPTRNVASVQKRTSSLRKASTGSSQVAEHGYNPRPRDFKFYCLPATLILSSLQLETFSLYFYVLNDCWLPRDPERNSIEW